MVTDTNTKKLNRDIEFLFEIGTLRKVPRGWSYLTPGDFHTLTEHIFYTMWTSYVLSNHFASADKLKVLKIALSYNLYRSRTGDPHYISRNNVGIDKEGAFSDMVAGTSFSGLQESFEEYLKKESKESKIVFVANGIQNLIQLNLLKETGVKVAERWITSNYDVFYDQIPLKVGKKYWDVLKEVTPNDWHLLSKDDFGFNSKATKKLSQLTKDIHFLYELTSLGRIVRTWDQFGGLRMASVAEHSVRSILLSQLIGNSIDAAGDLELILTLMLHDLSEIRSCDLNYVQINYVKRNETAAFEETTHWLSDGKLITLSKEFDDKSTEVSKIAYDADKLEPLFELVEQKHQGNSIATVWMENYEKALQKKLYNGSSRDLLKSLISSDPHAWHSKRTRDAISYSKY